MCKISCTWKVVIFFLNQISAKLDRHFPTLNKQASIEIDDGFIKRLNDLKKRKTAQNNDIYHNLGVDLLFIKFEYNNNLQ